MRQLVSLCLASCLVLGTSCSSALHANHHQSGRQGTTTTTDKYLFPNLQNTVWMHTESTPQILEEMGVHYTANSSNVPLFSTLTMNFDYSPSSSSSTNAVGVNFTYAPNFVDYYTVDDSQHQKTAKHFYYPNMFMGLEFVEGTMITYNFLQQRADKTYLSYTTVRYARSQQEIAFPIYQIHTYEVISVNATFSYMNYTQRTTGPWIDAFSWLFVPSSSSSGSLHSAAEKSPSPPSHFEGLEKEDDIGLIRRRYLEKQKSVEHLKALHETPSSSSSWHTCTPTPTEELLKIAANPSATYVVYLNHSWEMANGAVGPNAFMIGLQGLLNRNTPRLYFVYPPSWVWTDTQALYNYYSNQTQNPELNFTQLCSFDDVLTVFLSSTFSDASIVPVNYVKWDNQVRQSLLNAYTIAGIDNMLVVDETIETQVGAASMLGRNKPLSLGKDLNKIFRNMTDLEATQWAIDRYWNRTNKDYVVWLGGDMGPTIHPGVGDIGVAKKCFFAALSTSPVVINPTTVGEYQVADKLMSEMNPGFFLLGWHAYGKDAEHTYTTMASQNKGTVHGLNTNPNLSFGNQVPLPSGYRFFPTKQPKPAPPVPGSKKNGLRVGLVQTDGLGLGAWTKPGRGDLPYTWEITLPDFVIQPAILRYFYENATKNDFFTACLGGPGYMYPKAVPFDYLPTQLTRAKHIMEPLGLHSMVIFDASNCTANKERIQITPMSDSNIPKKIVDTYFNVMPNASGFFNGYAPSYTFQHNDRTSSSSSSGGRTSSSFPTNQSFVSFDYYVDPSRDFDDVVKDLKILTKANPVRPYYLAIHVREFNTEARLADIFKVFESESGEEIELLSADNFMEEVSGLPTFTEHH